MVKLKVGDRIRVREFLGGGGPHANMEGVVVKLTAKFAQVRLDKVCSCHFGWPAVKFARNGLDKIG
jgi:hypothetical protein